MHRNNFGSLTGLARTLALPGDTKPVRFPSFPALERTAVLGLNHSTVHSPYTGDSKIAVLRQATYPLWADVHRSHLAFFEFDAIGELGYRNLVHPTIRACLAGGSGGLQTGTFVNPPIILGFWDTPALKHPIMGLDDRCGPAPFIYVPRGAQMFHTTRYTGTPNGTEKFCIDYQVWQGPGETSDQTFTSSTAISAGGTVTFSIASVGADRWIRLNQYGSDMTTSTLKFYEQLETAVHTGTAVATALATGNCIQVGMPNPATMFLPIATMPDYHVSNVPWSSTRVTAVSLLATNTTKAINKEGTVLWGRIDPQQYDLFSVTSDQVASLHPSEKAFLPLEEGCYTYTMPSSDIMVFSDYIHKVDTFQVPIYRLDHVGMMNVGFFQDPDTTATPTQLALNLDMHLEFRTTSALFQIGMCGLPVETLHQAQLILMKIGFFFQNANHESLIHKGLRLFASASPVLELMGPIGKGLAGSAKMAQTLARAGPHKPPSSKMMVQTNNKKKKDNKPKPKQNQKKKGGLQMYLDSKKNRK